MYKCNYCDLVFDEPEFAPHKGEDGCPACGSEYQEVEKCSICGEYFADDEFAGGVCETCIDKYEYDLEMCLKIGSLATEKVEINSCIASLLDEEEINTILANFLRSSKEEISCKTFIDDDKSWFADQLTEELRRGETE